MVERASCIWLCVLVAVPVYATQAESRKVVVLPLQASRMDADTTGVLNELLAAYVRHAGGYDVIAKADIDAMLGLENLKDELGCDNATCAAEIGGALGAELLISGRAARLGDSVILILKLIDTRVQTVIRSAKHKVSNDENLFDAAIEEVGRRLLGLQPLQVQTDSQRQTIHVASLNVSTIERNCMNGEPKACLDLGVRFASGDGVSRDDGAAKRWLRQSCNSGLQAGCLELSRAGEWVDRDKGSVSRGVGISLAVAGALTAVAFGAINGDTATTKTCSYFGNASEECSSEFNEGSALTFGALQLLGYSVMNVGSALYLNGKAHGFTGDDDAYGTAPGLWVAWSLAFASTATIPFVLSKQDGNGSQVLTSVAAALVPSAIFAWRMGTDSARAKANGESLDFALVPRLNSSDSGVMRFGVLSAIRF